ncbi:S8 family serine peptidase [Fusibacter sp. JL216-2]|uniref:S8 family serine peptidase n=1 Tax=Fusibacter sp. JL216-2 TaxID=3071453 RepID=UPI003D333933
MRYRFKKMWAVLMVMIFLVNIVGPSVVHATENEELSETTYEIQKTKKFIVLFQDGKSDLAKEYLSHYENDLIKNIKEKKDYLEIKLNDPLDLLTLSSHINYYNSHEIFSGVYPQFYFIKNKDRLLNKIVKERDLTEEGNANTTTSGSAVTVEASTSVTTDENILEKKQIIVKMKTDKATSNWNKLRLVNEAISAFSANIDSDSKNDSDEENLLLETKLDAIKNRIESKRNVKASTLKSEASQGEIKIKNKVGNIQIVEVTEAYDVEEVVDELTSDPDIEYAQPNYKLSLFSTDPYYPNQWGLENKAQNINGMNGLSSIDINLVTAWDKSKGYKAIVGVLDSGIDIYHPDLKNNIYVNDKEVPNNGLDDDGNGFVDDVNGWDFYNGDNSVYDKFENDHHGTHIAGIIGAGQNGIGISGVAPEVQIMPLKFYGKDGGYTSDVIEAILYAESMGVDVINCSFGGPEENYALKEAIENSDIIFVTSAGNNNEDLSSSPVYPAAYELDNIITVGAIDNKGTKSLTSNYGELVDVYAPGVDIISTAEDNLYVYGSGTSQASAFVSGIVALIRASNKSVTPLKVKNALIDGGKYNEDTAGKLVNADSSYFKFDNLDAEFNKNIADTIEVYNKFYEQLDFVNEGVAYTDLSINQQKRLIDVYKIDKTYFENMSYEGRDLVESLNDLEKTMFTRYESSWVVQINDESEIKINTEKVEELNQRLLELKAEVTSGSSIQIHDISPQIVSTSKIGDSFIELTLDSIVSWRDIVYILGGNSIENIQPNFKYETFDLKLKSYEKAVNESNTFGLYISDEDLKEWNEKNYNGEVFAGTNITSGSAIEFKYVLDSELNSNRFYPVTYNEKTGIKTSDILKSIELFNEEGIDTVIQSYKSNVLDYALQNSFWNSGILTKQMQSDYDLYSELSSIEIEQLHYGEEGINPYSGNFSHSVTDIEIDVPGFKDGLVRTYNSKSEKDVGLGKGWSFNLDCKLYERLYMEGYDVENRGNVVASIPGGGSVTFHKSNGEYDAKGLNHKLELINDKFILRTDDGYKYSYKRDTSYTPKEDGVNFYTYYLDTITDPSENYIKLDFSEEDSIDGVVLNYFIDSSGKRYDFYYGFRDGSVSTYGLLDRIVDRDGNGVKYYYDSSRNVRYAKKLIDGKEVLTESYRYSRFYKGANLRIHQDKMTEVSYNKGWSSNPDEIIDYKDGYNGKAKAHTICGRIKRSYHASGYPDAFAYITEESLDSSFDERVIRKDYDKYGYIVRVTYPDGRVQNVSYQHYYKGYWDPSVNYGDIKKYVDLNGNETSFVYKDFRVQQMINPDGSVKKYEYDNTGYKTLEIDEIGVLVSTTTQNGLPLNVSRYLSADESLVKKYTYTSQKNTVDNAYEKHNLVSRTLKGLIKTEVDEEGFTKSYTYNYQGNVATKTVGAVTKYFLYDDDGNQVAESFVDIEFYDDKNAIYSREFDSSGNLLRERTINSNGDFCYVRNIYNSKNELIRSIKADQYDISNESNIDNIAESVYTHNDLGYSYQYNNLGEKILEKDPQGNITKYEYDAVGNIKKKVYPDGSSNYYEYDLFKNLTHVYFKEADLESDVTKGWLIESYKYETVPIEGSANKKKVTKTEYLSEDRSKFRETISIYDFKDKLLTETYDDGSKIENAYLKNGLLDYSVNKLGGHTYYDYDKLNRLIRKWTEVEKNEYRYEGITYFKNDKVKSKSTSDLIVIIAEGRPNITNIPESLITREFKYNSSGDITEERITSLADGLDNELLIKTNYDSRGFIDNKYTFVSKSESIFEEYDYDNYGRVVNVCKTVRKGDLKGYDFSSNEMETTETVYRYNGSGKIDSLQTPVSTTEYRYDELGRVVSETIKDVDYVNSSGVNLVKDKMVTKDYDFNGNVETIIDANGNKTEYRYDSRGNLLYEKKTVTSEGTEQTLIHAYEYDFAGRLIAEVTPENYTGSTIDISSSLSSYSRTEYTYNDVDQLILETYVYLDEQNKWTTIVNKAYDHDAAGNIVKELNDIGYNNGTGDVSNKIATGYGAEFTYNLVGEPTEILSAEHKSSGIDYTSKTVYNGRGLVSKEIDGLGNEFIKKYDAFGNLIETRHNPSNGPEVTLSKAKHNYIGLPVEVRDGENNVTAFKYNAFGQVREEVYPYDESIGAYSIKYQYDENGRVLRKFDTAGKEEIFSYNKLGNITSKTLKTTSGTGKVYTAISKYDLNGNLRYSTDPNGNIIETKYDELDRVISTIIDVKDVDGEVTKHIEEKVYDKNNNITVKRDWTGNEIHYKYDDIDRLVQTIDPSGIVIEKRVYDTAHQQRFSYNAKGNYSEFVYNKDGQIIEEYDLLRRRIIKTYDIRGNVKTIKNDVKNVTDQSDLVTTYIYDSMNRLWKVINAKGETSEYLYDLNGNLVFQKDGRGITTTNEYNTRGLLKRRIDDGGRTGTEGNYQYTLGKVENYTYYSNGQRHTILDRNQNIITETYNLLGLIKTRSAGEIELKYEYDGVGNLIKMSDQTGTTIYEYDALGRNISKSVPNQGKVTFKYDVRTDEKGDSLMSGYTSLVQTDPAGVMQKVFDKHGRLKQVVDGIGSNDLSRTIYEYDEIGNKTKVLYQSGVQEVYTYYPDNQIKSLVNKNVDGSNIDSYLYTYNELTGLQETVQDSRGKTTYVYDELNRLKVIEEPDMQTIYSYDASGNRRSELKTNGIGLAVQNYYYDERNRLTGTKAEHFKYSFSGRPIINEINEQNNEYNVFNQLVKTVQGGKTVQNIYNGRGQRVVKKVADKETHYLYVGRDVVLERNKNGDVTARNTMGTSLISRQSNGEEYNYLFNAHGDVTALIDQTGVIKAKYMYDAFGNPIESQDMTDNPFRYSAYQYDEETDMYYLNARMYDAKYARFLQEDTYRGQLSDPLSLNLYTYTSNNPIKYYDPSGHNQQMKQKNDNSRHSEQVKMKTDNGEKYVEKDEVVKKVESVINKLHESGGTLQVLGSEDILNDANKKNLSSLESLSDLDALETAEEVLQGTYQGLEFDTLTITVDDIKYKYDATKNEFSEVILTGEGESQSEYVFAPSNWQNELQSNIEPLIDQIPSNITGDQRNQLVDAIILAEAKKLQNKYDTIYNSSDNVIYGLRTMLTGQENVHDTLSPLYEEYIIESYEQNKLVEAFVEGFTIGLHAGTWHAASLPTNNGTQNVFSAGSKSDAITALADLPDDVASNFKRFIRKSGSGYTEYTVDVLENGNYQMKMLKPGNHSGYAEYYKIIDSSGKTVNVYKDTFTNAGNFIHRKYK